MSEPVHSVVGRDLGQVLDCDRLLEYLLDLPVDFFPDFLEFIVLSQPHRLLFLFFCELRLLLLEKSIPFLQVLELVGFYLHLGLHGFNLFGCLIQVEVLFLWCVECVLCGSDRGEQYVSRASDHLTKQTFLVLRHYFFLLMLQQVFIYRLDVFISAWLRIDLR